MCLSRGLLNREDIVRRESVGVMERYRTHCARDVAHLRRDPAIIRSEAKGYPLVFEMWRYFSGKIKSWM